eukprot:gene52966-43827_t
MPRLTQDDGARAAQLNWTLRCDRGKASVLASRAALLQLRCTGGFANAGVLYATPGPRSLRRWVRAVEDEPANGLYGDQGPLNM